MSPLTSQSCVNGSELRANKAFGDLSLPVRLRTWSTRKT